jgi:hypothetical protein
MKAISYLPCLHLVISTVAEEGEERRGDDVGRKTVIYTSLGNLLIVCTCSTNNSLSSLR